MKKNLFFASSGGANIPPAKKPWSSLQNIRRTMVFLFVMLFSLGAWAATPDFESYDWTESSIAEVPGDHDGIVISYAGLNAPGNVSGHWYIPNNQNLKNSDSEWKYFGIAANAQIDSVAFLYCPNGSNKTSIAWVAWGEGVTPNQYVLGHGETAGTTSSKSWDNAIWETIDLSSIEAYTVYTSRSIREFREIGESSNMSNFGAGQTINILGIRVWLHPSAAIDPVSSVSVAGATEGYIGVPVALTASFDKTPNSIKWFVDGVEQAGATAATFNFTPAAAQTYSIVCQARNDNNDEGAYIASTAHSVTASKLCGMLIKATHTGATAASIDENSVLGGNVDKSTQANGKLGSNDHYFGVKLASGNFQAGDVVTIVASELQGGNTATVYSNKGETLIGSAAFATETNTAVVTLTASCEWIYLYRKDSGCNPVVNYIQVDRSCTESSDCSISSLTIGGDAVSAEGKVFSKEFSAGDATTNVEIAFTIHALASASPASGFSMDVPAVGDPANSRTITVTAEDGTQDTYTVTLNRSASLSDDATLSALAVEGFTLDPVFDAATTAYTISKAYGSDNPALSLVSATKNYDAASVADAVYDGNDIVITVTAEDGVATKEYRITVEEAAAPRALNEVIMSNKYMAYVLDGDATKTLHAFYLSGEAEPSIQSVNVSEGATWAVNEGKLKVTGADAGFDEYPLDIVAVTPVEYGTDKITFDGSETWVKSGYGWDANKKWKFSKTDEDYSREKSGKTHIEFFLPACDTVEIYESNTAARDIRVYINGVQFGDKVKLAKNGTLKFAVKQENAFMLTIASAQTGGDGGVGALRMAKAIVVDPTITFSNGAYTIDGAALDLSTLFTSNSDGAVTYSITAAGETGATLVGANFTATAAGEVTVRADQEAATGFNAAYATATITVSEPAAPVDPTITFNAGNYTVGAAALDLSTLFNSNSVGEVTYSIVDAGETGATLDDANFTATAAGTATVRASQAAATGFNAKTADAVITVAAAPAEVDGVKLVVAGELTGNFRTTASFKNESKTIDGIEYTKYVQLSSRSSWGSQPAGPDAYLLQYTLNKKNARFYYYANNTNGSEQNVKVYVKEEGESVVTINVPVAANTADLVFTDVNVSKNAEVWTSVSNTALHIFQAVVVESGDVLPQAGSFGYEIDFNKGRLSTKSATLTSLDGMSYYLSSDYKIDNSSYVKIATFGTHYIKFTLAESTQVEITTNNTKSYYIGTSLDTESDEAKLNETASTKNVVNKHTLAAGTYYISPKSDEVQILKIAFAEPPVAYSVTYVVNGATGDAPVQADLYEGDKFNVASATGLEKTGYDFDGWLCSVDNAKYAAGAEYTMTAEATTFTAQWIEHVQSSDATLSVLEVAGLTLLPAFDPATEAYTATLPFYASMPAVGDVTATKNSEYAAAPVVTIAANVISVTVTAENNDVKTYTITVNQEAAPAASSSINIEQYVLDNRKGNNESEGIALAQAMFTAANISYANINALDSLNDDKTNRNNAYLGAKIKSNGGYLEIAVPAEKSLKVKFGNIAADVAVMINGVAQDDHSKSTEIYELAAANELRVVRLSTTTSGTVVFKQIMIGEDIADVVLPYGIAIADGIENGAIAAAKWALPGTNVDVTVTPADGYVLENLFVNEEAQGAVTSFTMPSENVTISATFVASAPTPVDPVYTVVRDGLTSGYFYTMCLANNVTAARGASFWKPAGYNDSSVELEEVVGELEAGIPYFFKAEAATLEVVYGDENAAIAGENNGLVGSFTEEDIQAGAGNYILFNNKLYEVAATQLAKVGAYRAYINIGQINNVAPAPGMRRMAMPIQRGTATGIEAIEVGAELKKVVIDGQLYIVRDGRMYDVTGQLVR